MFLFPSLRKRKSSESTWTKSCCRVIECFMITVEFHFGRCMTENEIKESHWPIDMSAPEANLYVRSSNDMKAIN